MRLFALKWFLTGLISIIAILVVGTNSSFSIFGLIPYIAYLVLSLLFWFVSPALSKKIVGDSDGQFVLKGVTSDQLYTTVFLGFGVYFVMNSFPDVLGRIHYFATNHNPEVGGIYRGKVLTYYDLSEPLLTMIGGIFLIGACKNLARLLTGRKDSEQDIAPSDR